MAKKKETAAESEDRLSRKEILRQRKQEEQLRTIRVGVIVVVLLLAGILLFAVVNEYVLSPQRSVATVGTETISLREFQDRVRLERAQRIITLDDQLEMFNNDVGLIQQFSGQTISELASQNNELFGESILEQMARDKIVHQALVERGESVTDEEVDQRIGAAYNYFSGESPTSTPVPTATIELTPSVTPIGATPEAQTETEGPLPAEEVLDAPTPTPVSAESFEEEFGTLMARYAAMGVSEQSYRDYLKSALESELFLEVLGDENELPETDLQASALLLLFGTEAEALQALDQVAESDFLTLWNTVRSAPADAEVAAIVPAASEINWQTSDALATNLGQEFATAIFDTPVGDVTQVLEIQGSDGEPRYLVAQVTGREERPLSASELRQRQVDLYSAFIDEKMASDVEIGDYWRGRVPTTPMLDTKFLQPPTPTPLAEPTE